MFKFKEKMKRLVTTAILAMLCVGCAPDTGVMNTESANRAKAFFGDSSVARQMTSFCRYPVGQQYEIFIYGNQRRHPPAQYLARCFALNGDKGVELLRSKLIEAHDDLTLRDIMRLLKEIDRMNMYDVAGDEVLMSAARIRIATMTDSGWKDSAQRLLREIGHDRESDKGEASRCCQAGK